MGPIRGGLWLSYFGNPRPPFDAPGFEQQWQNPAWSAWRGGNATWQSNVCSYALIKQHHTGSVGTDCGPDGEPRPRPDGAVTSMPGGVRRCHS